MQLTNYKTDRKRRLMSTDIFDAIADSFTGMDPDVEVNIVDEQTLDMYSDTRTFTVTFSDGEVHAFAVSVVAVEEWGGVE